MRVLLAQRTLDRVAGLAVVSYLVAPHAMLISQGGQPIVSPWFWGFQGLALAHAIMWAALFTGGLITLAAFLLFRPRLALPTAVALSLFGLVIAPTFPPQPNVPEALEQLEQLREAAKEPPPITESAVPVREIYSRSSQAFLYAAVVGYLILVRSRLPQPSHGGAA